MQWRHHQSSHDVSTRTREPAASNAIATDRSALLPPDFETSTHTAIRSVVAVSIHIRINVVEHWTKRSSMTDVITTNHVTGALIAV